MCDEDDKNAAKPTGMMMGLMRAMGRLMPTRDDGENPTAVRAFQLADRALEVINGKALSRSFQRMRGQTPWPVVSGSYVIGDPDAPVAICTLTSDSLMAPTAALNGVAISGLLHVPNLGIEKIIKNITANDRIRFLILCGVESAVFSPGQALVSLAHNGVDAENRIVGAVGPMPVLTNLPLPQIEAFREQVTLIECTGELETGVIEKSVNDAVARNPGPYAGGSFKPDDSPTNDTALADDGFVSLNPGGRRPPAEYDKLGFFVISMDQAAKQIVLHHYRADHSPAHVVRARSGEAIFRAVIRENLVSQMSHAGYLGQELAKADTALRLGLRYEQDKPLKGDSAR